MKLLKYGGNKICLDQIIMTELIQINQMEVHSTGMMMMMVILIGIHQMVL